MLLLIAVVRPEISVVSDAVKILKSWMMWFRKGLEEDHGVIPCLNPHNLLPPYPLCVFPFTVKQNVIISVLLLLISFVQQE